MKKLVMMLLLLTSNAFASGKLQVQGNVTDGENVRPQVGFAIWHPLMKKVAFNSWTGWGVRPYDDQEDVNWLVAKNEVQLFLGKRWTVSPGFEWGHDFTSQQSLNKFYVRADLKLW